MADNVKRYDFKELVGMRLVHSSRIESAKGLFVLYTDYEKFEQENERLKQTLDRISSMCKIGCAGCEAIYIESEAAIKES